MSGVRLCLVRHGETDWNAARRIQGQIDSALNATGVAQAAAAARTLADVPFAAVYSSDLQRARITAEKIVAGRATAVQTAPALRERHYGIFQGLTYDEAQARYPEAYARFAVRDPDYDFESGESLQAFAQRVRECLNRIAETWTGAQVLAVAHGGVLDIAHRLASGQPLTTPRDFTISNAGVSWIERVEGSWRVLSWNVEPASVHGLDELPG